ncbi:DUF721 domain-containing protein [Enemella sp. A6]|uniref:DUF721 domain-containing protein n=1 Tax=Enemella sp. A6 TaxID=3440152 RepID=UPI003EB9A4D2
MPEQSPETPDTASDPAQDHDPTGLELAMRVAAAVGKGNAPRARRPKPAASRPAAPRSRDRDPKLLGPALEHLISDRGWSTEINVHTLLGRWPSLVGEVNAEHSRPESYSDGVLVVRTDSTVWATSLRTIAHQLVARLNDELGQGTVTRVRVLGPAAPSWKHGRRSVRGRGPRDTYG